ncbi:MAG: hypothetical protein JKX68_13085, partial [Flavobacteriales bacterium]|nr:hypothetical protein [Flavobacteriales bacterium]
MLKKLLFILLLSQGSVTLAQDIPIGDWRDHLPYSDAVSISFGDNIIYCATNSAVFTYDQSDMTIDRLNLVNGLSDIGLSKINFNNYNKSIVIGYKNGNLDVIDKNKTITNLSFIKNSNVVGSKSINHIYFQGKLAYLSTGFGIVILDTDKLEIVDTYLFGPLGGFMLTNAVTIDSLNIYAATDQGVYFANKNSANLTDFNEWSLLTDLGTAKYSNIVTYSGRVFTSLESAAWNGDSLYFNDGGVWQKFIAWGVNINSLNVSNNRLLISYNSQVNQIKQSLSTESIISNHKSLFPLSPVEAVIDNEGYMLIAEESHGIIRAKNNWDSEIIVPNGPSSSSIFKMDIFQDDLWFVSGAYDPQTYGPNSISKNLINYRIEGSWNTVAEQINNISGNVATDAVSVIINPRDQTQVFFGTWDNGLFASYDSKRPVLPWVSAIIERRIIDYIRKVTVRNAKETLTSDGDVTNFEADTKIIKEEFEFLSQL